MKEPFLEVCYGRIWGLIVLFTLIWNFTLIAQSEAARFPKICQDGWRYHTPSKKCYELSAKGPCGNIAHWGLSTYDMHSGVGQCKCDQQICNLARPRIEWGSRCYHIYDQGPCGRGEWIVPTSKDSAHCEKIPCMEEYVAQERPSDRWKGGKLRQFLFPYKGKCYRTLETGFPGCPWNQKVYFDALWFNGRFRCHGDPVKLLTCVMPEGKPQPHGWDPCGDGNRPDKKGGCNPIALF